MAVRLCQECDPRFIRDVLAIFQQDWPDLNLFEWAEGVGLATKAEWIGRYAYFWHVWSCDRLAGYFAAVDLGRGRWSIHFGSRRSQKVGREMLVAWRKIEQIAKMNEVRLMVAYISLERPDIQRAARIFKFRQFKTLWANLLHPTSNLHPRRHLPSPPKTKECNLLVTRNVAD